MGAISLLYSPTILLMLTVISTIPAWAVMTLLTMWDKLPLKIEWADAVFYLSGLFFFGVIGAVTVDDVIEADSEARRIARRLLSSRRRTDTR